MKPATVVIAIALAAVLGGLVGVTALPVLIKLPLGFLLGYFAAVACHWVFEQ
jgi:hypothetical protein